MIPNSLYKSEKSKKQILNLYDKKLDELDIRYESIYIDTAFGKTHILRTGSSTAPPLILVHGTNGCAPIALESYPNLSAKYQIFCVDVMAQPNKSAETRLSMKDESYGIWMNEVIHKLNLISVTMLGFSFGGLIILKTLEYDECKIKKVYLSAPAYIVNGSPIKALFKVFIPMKRFMKSRKIKYVKKFLSHLFTEQDDFALAFLQEVLL